MQTVTGIIHGVFQAAYAYQGHLIAVRDDTEVVAVPLYDLLKGLKLNSRDRFIVEHSFLRNDRLCSTMMQDLAKVGLLRPFSTLYPGRDSLTYILNANSLDSAPRMSLPKDAGFVLDCEIYFREAIFATRSGLYRALFNVSEDTFAWREVDRSHDGPVYMVDVRYGAVTLACGSDGVMGQIVWRLRGEDGTQDPGRWNTEQLLSGDVTRTAWWSHDILAFDTKLRMGCIHNEMRKHGTGPTASTRAERLGCGGLGWTDPTGLASCWRGNPTAGFSSQHRVYLSDRDRGTVMLRQSGRGVTLNAWEDLEEQPDLLTSEYCFNGHYMPKVGVIADTDQGTLLVSARKQPVVLSSEENVAIKTFGRSQHYTRLICSVKDHHIELMAIWPTVKDLTKESTWE
ncbi:MAG: hypothetical protein ABFE07_14660 [Armatimonadia bacterium]